MGLTSSAFTNLYPVTWVRRGSSLDELNARTSLCSYFVVVLRASFVEMDVGRRGWLAGPPCVVYFRYFIDGGHAHVHHAHRFAPTHDDPLDQIVL